MALIHSADETETIPSFELYESPQRCSFMSILESVM